MAEMRPETAARMIFAGPVIVFCYYRRGCFATSIHGGDVTKDNGDEDFCCIHNCFLLLLTRFFLLHSFMAVTQPGTAATVIFVASIIFFATTGDDFCYFHS